jgi:predicted ATPase
MMAQGVQYELPLNISEGTYCRGWVLSRQGNLAAAIPLLEDGTNGFRQAEHTMFQTYRLGALADLYIQAHRLEEAEATLQEARFISEKGHERFWDTELHRLYGDLAQARGETDVAVERHYIQAFELARTQQSNTLELRAAISLARLWRKQGAYAKAYTMLSETVNWFTEGFDTFHFKTATALLDELSGARQSQPDHPADIHSVGSTNGHWRSQTGSDE